MRLLTAAGRGTAVTGALLVLVAPLVLAAPAGAVSSAETAYFFTGQQPGGVLPPPPNVPPKGLWVSSNASGPQATSALRFTLASAESAPTVTLKVHSTSGTVALFACPTTSSWKAGDDQPFSAQPKSDCKGEHAVGGLSADMKTLQLDLSGLRPVGGKIDVALVPAPPSEPTGGLVAAAPATNPVFDITFEPFTADQVMVTSAAADTSSSGAISSPSSDVSSSSGSSSGSGSVGSSDALSAPSGAFSAALPAASPSAAVSSAPFTPPPAATPTPTTPPATAPARVQLATGPVKAKRAVSSDKTSRAKRTILGVALLALVALAVPSGGKVGDLASAITGGGPPPARGRMTLYDSVPEAAAVEAPRMALGDAPALR